MLPLSPTQPRVITRRPAIIEEFRMPSSNGYMTVAELRSEVENRRIDTVIVALVDMQGRLAGKRFTGRFFLDEVVGHGTEGCSYLLAVDVEMNTVDGYRISSWESGYGDFVLS